MCPLNSLLIEFDPRPCYILICQCLLDDLVQSNIEYVFHALNRLLEVFTCDIGCCIIAATIDHDADRFEDVLLSN